jgi:hypothetical protein
VGKKARDIRQVIKDDYSLQILFAVFHECAKRQYNFPTNILASAMTTAVKRKCRFSHMMHIDDIFRSLYPLHTWRFNKEAETKFVEAVTQKIIECNHGALHEAPIVNAFRGMRHMRSEEEYVRELLTAVTERIEKSDLQWNSYIIGNSLYSMKNMSCSHKEVRRAMRVYGQKISSSDSHLENVSVANALLGFRRMKAVHPEVRTGINSYI